jgi:hypothetical protein
MTTHQPVHPHQTQQPLPKCSTIDWGLYPRGNPRTPRLGGGKVMEEESNGQSKKKKKKKKSHRRSL